MTPHEKGKQAYHDHIAGYGFEYPYSALRQGDLFAQWSQGWIDAHKAHWAKIKEAAA